jgi:RNA polymerase sigma-70 factor (family 1)
MIIFGGLNKYMEPVNSPDHLIQKNDIKAFKLFFESFYRSVCVFAYNYIKDENLAEDIAQEAFIEYWKKKENFEDIKAVKGFIYKVTKHKCLNNIKRRNITESLLKHEIFSNEYFYELILEEETYKIIHQSVNKLAPQSQKIVWLSMEGIKNQEIADQLRISLNTVKTLKKNAYQKLRNQLKNQVFILLLLCHFLD